MNHTATGVHTTPFRAAAWAYWAAGWAPIPVWGKTTPIGGATGNAGTVTPDKIVHWMADPGVGENIAIRHQGTVAIDVDDAYTVGDTVKSGRADLAAYARRHGLPPLPATWSSTARGAETWSRQYLYALPDGRKLTAKPCESVEICQRHNRFTVAAPSIHPQLGAAYTWYPPGGDGVPPTWAPATGRRPRADELPELPAAWRDRLTAPERADLDASIPVPDLAELLAAFDGRDEPCAAIAWHLGVWADPASHVGHDQAFTELFRALRFGREGHAGVPELVDLLVTRFGDHLSDARPREAERELSSLITACVTRAVRKPVDWVNVCRCPRPGGEAAALETLAAHTGQSHLGYLTARSRWMREDSTHRLHHHAVHMARDITAGRYTTTDALSALRAELRRRRDPDPAEHATALLGAAAPYSRTDVTA